MSKSNSHQEYALPAFGEDPMDRFSVPIEVINTALTKLYTLDRREKPEKPGRALSVVWDERSPIMPGFENKYSYIVRFNDTASQAGNHYHIRRNEFYKAVAGKFTIVLENIETRQQESIALSDESEQFLYVPPKHSHLVIPEAENSVLLIISDYPELAEDQIDYKVDLGKAE